MNPAVELVEECLACARLTQLAVNDQIPLVAVPRSWLASRYAGTSLAYLLSCPHCMAVWMAGLGLLCRAVAPRQWVWVRRGLAVAMVAGHLVARLED